MVCLLSFFCLLLQVTPGGTLVVGLAAGGLSTLGFKYLTPILDTKLGLRDTCGIHNLHGGRGGRAEGGGGWQGSWARAFL